MVPPAMTTRRIARCAMVLASAAVFIFLFSSFIRQPVSHFLTLIAGLAFGSFLNSRLVKVESHYHTHHHYAPSL
jgi:hypothetical protein